MAKFSLALALLELKPDVGCDKHVGHTTLGAIGGAVDKKPCIFELLSKACLKIVLIHLKILFPISIDLFGW